MTVAKPPSGLPESVPKGASLSSGAYAASLKPGDDTCEAETQNTAEYTVARHFQGAGAAVMAALSVSDMCRVGIRYARLMTREWDL